MSASPVLTSRFNENATLDWQFSKLPKLTLREAFDGMTPLLPAGAIVMFDNWNNQIITDIYPFCGQTATAWTDKPEPTRLSYQHYGAHQSVRIKRIHVAGEDNKGKGIGSAMLASQLPFWDRMGIKTITVQAHEMSKGFYAKIGFEEVSHLPEEPFADYNIAILMLLDLQNKHQNSVFRQTLAEANPLQTRTLDL